MSKLFYTDYPFEELKDKPGKEAPIRSCELIGYDQDKYAAIMIGNNTLEVKLGYVYHKHGRYGTVPSVSHNEAMKHLGIRDD